jgi:hypothetical protein
MDYQPQQHLWRSKELFGHLNKWQHLLRLLKADQKHQNYTVEKTTYLYHHTARGCRT